MVYTPTPSGSGPVHPVHLADLSGLGLEAALIGSDYYYQGSWYNYDKWGTGGMKTGATLSYSFDGPGSLFASGYGDGEYKDCYFLSPTEKAGVSSALAKWSGLANLTFVQVTDGQTVGDLRFGITSVNAADENGHAYLPDGSPEGGDVWLSAQNWHTNPSTVVAPGTYDYLTLIHEIGHALDLKHPFEDYPQLDGQNAQYDNYSYTVMSYTAKYGLNNNYASFYPTTPMYFDIQAIQDLYGAKPHNDGDTVYSFSSTGHYWRTIDDSGGYDTIAVTGLAPVRIDLRAWSGSGPVTGWSDIGAPITFSNGSHQYATVMLSARTIIEKAIGGGGNDQITGNAVPNTIVGRAGNDVLTGIGTDDTFKFGAGFGHDIITDFSAGATNNDFIAISHTLLADFGAVISHAHLNAAGDVVIKVDANDSIRLEQVQHISDLTSNDFLFT
jgi:Ca2+-binding RTX toxin-like protein